MELSAGIKASLAGRYASALFDLASEAGTVTAVEADLDKLGEAEVPGNPGHDPADLLAADFGIPDQRAQLGGFVQRGGQLVEIGLDRGDRAGLAGEIEQRAGVTPCQASLDTGGKIHA